MTCRLCNSHGWRPKRVGQPHRRPGNTDRCPDFSTDSRFDGGGVVLDPYNQRGRVERSQPKRACLMKTVYLAGAMEFAADGGTSWRVDLTRWLAETLGHAALDPTHLEHDQLSEEERLLLPSLRQRDFDTLRAIARNTIRYDIDLVLNRCDYLIVHWTNPPSGAAERREKSPLRPGRESLSTLSSTIRARRPAPGWSAARPPSIRIGRISRSTCWPPTGAPPHATDDAATSERR